MNIKRSKLSVGHLVAPRKKQLESRTDGIWCTISPNPATLHDCHRINKASGKMRSVKIPYGNLPQAQQYEYCMRILENCYQAFLSDDAEIYGCAELNQSANVHFHFVIYDKQFNSDTRLKIFQRDISCCMEVIQNMSKKDAWTIKRKNGQLPRDYMNNICKLTDSLDDRLDYMDKDHDPNDVVFETYSRYPGIEKDLLYLT